jgi:hypothetical protein
MAEKIDLKLQDKLLYNPPSKEPVIVEVPCFNFLMLDGYGSPVDNPDYQQAVSTLFSASYALKFAVKKGLAIDYGVMPLEGLWWIEGELELTLENKPRWSWKMMIRQPEWVNLGLIEQVWADLRKKKDLPMLPKVRFELYDEGTSVQLMHIGPYVEEHENIMRMHHYAVESGYHLYGQHHEIYISDVTRTAPEKLKTILRQPIRK